MSGKKYGGEKEGKRRRSDVVGRELNYVRMKKKRGDSRLKMKPHPDRPCVSWQLKALENVCQREGQEKEHWEGINNKLPVRGSQGSCVNLESKSGARTEDFHLRVRWHQKGHRPKGWKTERPMGLQWG